MQMYSKDYVRFKARLQELTGVQSALPAIPVKAPRAELQVWVAKTNKNKN